MEHLTRLSRTHRVDGRDVASGYIASVRERDALTALRSWSWWLDDRGKIGIWSDGSANSVELRKRRWKTKPDLLVFRYRNANGTREFFKEVRALFDGEGIRYELELTPKRKAPRAIVIPHDPYSSLTPQMVMNLAGRVFSVSGETTDDVLLTCEGRLREDSHDPPLRFIIPPGEKPKAYEAGHRLGRSARMVVDKVLGVDT